MKFFIVYLFIVFALVGFSVQAKYRHGGGHRGGLNEPAAGLRAGLREPAAGLRAGLREPAAGLRAGLREPGQGKYCYNAMGPYRC